MAYNYQLLVNRAEELNEMSEAEREADRIMSRWGRIRLEEEDEAKMTMH